MMGAWERGLFLLCGTVLPMLVPLTTDKGAIPETAHPWETHAKRAGGADLASECGEASGNTNSPEGPYDELIELMSAEEGVDANLVHAIIAMESGYDRLALSPQGAKGLMQLMPMTAVRYAVSDPFDPAANIRGGIRYLRFLQERFSGRLRWALAAYHAGETAVLRYKGVPPFRETQSYVARVLAQLARRGSEAAQAALSLGSVGSGRATVQAVAQTAAASPMADAHQLMPHTHIGPTQAR